MLSGTGVETVKRGCDSQSFCSTPGVMCCTEELCNVGSDVPAGDGPEDDKESSTYLPQICPYSQKGGLEQIIC